MKKMLIFIGVVVVLFIALVLLSNTINKQEAEGNPFGKSKLHQETIKQLDNPLYQNIILPDELKEKLQKEETVTVYFYSPTCPACVKTSPTVVPLAEEMGIDLKMYNVLEFEEAWKDYHIEYTPTLIHFENGQEKIRFEGYSEAVQDYETWFNETK